MSQARRQNYFLHAPSAASIKTNPNYPGEFSIVTSDSEILVQGEGNISSCDLVCAQPCISQQFTITFVDADYGDCNSCGIAVGFLLSRSRDSLFDIADDLHLMQRIPYIYPEPSGGGVVTAATIASHFVDRFNNNTDSDQHDNFGITASSVGGVLTLIVPCPYRLSAIYNLENNGGYLPTIVNTVAGQEAFLTSEQLKRLFPKDINKIAGQWLDTANFSDCESVCILSLNGCYDPCASINMDRSHTVHMGTAGLKVAYDIFVNSNAPGYAAFITALAAALPTNCSALIPEYGSSTAFATGTAVQWAAGVNITTVGFTYSATSSFQISNGVVTLTVTAASAAALAAALVADTSTSITSAYAAPNLTVTGFGVNPITIRQVSL